MANLSFKTMSFGEAVCRAYGIDPSIALKDIKFNCEADKLTTINLSLVVTGEKLKDIGKYLEDHVIVLS